MDVQKPLDAEELARENADLLEQRRAVDEVLRAVARSEGLQPVLDAIIGAATRLCRGEHGQLYLADGDVFVIVSAVADPSEGYDWAVEHPHRRDRTTVVGRTALAGEVVQIPDVLDDPEYSFGAQAIIGYRALLGVPVVLEEELIGVVSVGRNVPGPYADREIELVRTFADQAVSRSPTRGCSTPWSGSGRSCPASSRRRSPPSSPRRRVSSSWRPPRVRHVPVRGPPRVHLLRRDGRARGAVRGAPPYHEAIGELIPAYGGTLEHFAGDGILVFFNDPSRSRITSSRRSASRSPRRIGSRSSRAPGASVGPCSGSGSVWRRGTRRSAGSGSRVGTTTRRWVP